MKPALCCTLFLLGLTRIFSQDWIPLGHGKLPIGYTIFSLYAVDDSVIWLTASLESVALGGNPVPLDHTLKVLRSVDAGQTWESHDVASGRFSFDIIAKDANTAWITTQTYGNGLVNGIFKTENGGDTWVKILNHGAGGVYIRKFDDTHLLCQANERVAWTVDEGSQWEIDTIHEYLPYEFNTLASGNNMVSFIGDTLWVGTNLGRIVRFTEFGANFEMIYTGTIYLIQSVSFADHLRGMIFHYNGTSGAVGLSRTFDGGDTWELTPSKPQTNKQYNITHVPGTASTFIAVTDYISEAAEYFWTTDFGETWTSGGEIKDAKTNSIYFLNPTTGWVSSGKITRPDEPIVYQWSGGIFTGTNHTFPETRSLHISPNPVKDVLHFSFQNTEQTNQVYTIINMDGKVARTGSVSQTNLDIHYLTPGLYSLKIEGGKYNYVGRFVKL